MIRFLLVGWLCLAVPLLSLAQQAGFWNRYQSLFRQGKTKEAQTVVAQWEKAMPRDPDLYVAKFNLILASAEVLAISTKPAKAGEIELIDEKTGQKAGSIGGGGYNPQKVQEALAVLRQGVAIAPDRLDMRFGMAKAAELADDPGQQLQVLREALAWRQSAQGRPWRWSRGGNLPAPEAQFVAGSIEEYMVPYWQSDTDAGNKQALALAELLLTYYPDSALGYFNKGNYYAFTQNDAEAYKWFVEADKRNPDDPQNVNNLLRICINIKRKAAAQTYLTRLCKYANFRDDCQRYTNELNKL